MPLSAAPSSKRLRLRVQGIVQGVGFRPFVYQLATGLGLAGFVFNDGEGVVIEIEGAESAAETFRRTLEASPPPLARIDRMIAEHIPPEGGTRFVIRRSEAGGALTMVSPDIALCDACAAEMRDPANRRYRYPFINCTDCGPRYTIVDALPYDRRHTSMRSFAMCPACEEEYNDPANRRYHAQPISCFDCGPELVYFETSEKQRPQENADTVSALKGSDALERCVEALRSGKIVAVKGLGGFHLMCDAGNETAVRRLRERKPRPSKPLAVMFPSLDMLKEEANVSEADERLILAKERPIVIVDKRMGATASVAHESIAPGIDRIGVFLPYTPLHVLLVDRLQRPLVATSANRGDEPILTESGAVRQKLGHVVDAILDHDREIVNACDDSVVMDAGGQRLMLRMARGFAPMSLPLPFETDKKILALGAHQKNAIALAFGRHMILSPHIGDLGTIDAFEYFERTLRTFKRFYNFEPDVLVCDKHPGYATTQWALQQKVPVIQVQHHYAHALACMAEYDLLEPVLAFCFDGTGYGDDKVNGEAGEGALGYGTLWGGEVLLADTQSYTRIAHLRPFRLLGGEKAVKEPRRVALSLLFECYGLDDVLAMDSPTVHSFDTEEIKTLHAMWRRGLNAPQSSSAGRLFDAAASLCGLAQTLGYEGESGLLLETAAGTAAHDGYHFNVRHGEIDWEPMVRAMIDDPSPAAVAAGLHATLTEIVAGIASQHREKPVLLCGGVFQNRLLVERVAVRLKGEGLRCYIQNATPVNDGGVALGQLYYALHEGEI